MTIERHDLDALFATAADHSEIPSASLIARILTDADAMQPGPVRAMAAPAAPRGWLMSLADFFGGGVSLAGMSIAAMAGLYIGVAQPIPLADLSSFVTGSASQSDSLDLLPSTSVMWAQE